MSRPQLTELRIADPTALWEALGFSVADEHVNLGGVNIVLGAPGEGITRWSIYGIPPTNDIDGLPTTTDVPAPQPQNAEHPNGAIGLDHVVITTPDFDRTARALDAHGLPLTSILGRIVVLRFRGRLSRWEPEAELAAVEPGDRGGLVGEAGV
ncbi:MAG: VOC family protein, partial [Solirubrobacteraceae bacterium]